MGLHILAHAILEGLHGSRDDVVDGILFGCVDAIFIYSYV